MGNALKKAKDAGIPVLTWDSDLLEKDKGLRLAYGFNHAEAQRAFRTAQKK